ncbi:3-hydroxyacyl-CoA dehydrogenase [Pontibacter qinzhouensis]|uniref:3-hydroxyacyl-CoA dehydrogenase n=1 Tax=Pontibacter qinzhouensis TaxID=2603253 RepID=A0A5C8JG51_9BACT|nr:3-hydroxyacyl-CoA dehydrogenase family protein [Pontibacter qinzhouensis]TXK36401.1 3-hydroxyacyl-CoA dehydrogenase [Pontibacter qinzhouensis]
MQILVVSTSAMAEEFKAKFPESNALFVQKYEAVEPLLEQVEVVFDFLLAEHKEQVPVYAAKPGLVVLFHAVTVQLAAWLQNQQIACTFVGFNGLPSLFNRPTLEVTLLLPHHAEVLRSVCSRLGTPYHLVEDRVGMVTPRVLCTIINEAFYTLQEKIATVPAIDLAMKLGTNYPQGPFEWAEQIGLSNVYKVLKALYSDTKDERYKICPLLKTKMLQQSLLVTYPRGL